MTPTPVATSLDLQEAAAFLGIHADTLRERAAAGIIPGAKIGKEWRFLDVDLAAWLRLQAPNTRAKSQYQYGNPDQLVQLYVPPARLWMRRKRDLSKAPTWAGVYFLYSNDALVYVGSSSSIRRRVRGHVSGGRVFDQFACVKAPGHMVVPLETVYIAMLRPPQNRSVGSVRDWVLEALTELAGIEDGWKVSRCRP